MLDALAAAGLAGSVLLVAGLVVYGAWAAITDQPLMSERSPHPDEGGDDTPQDSRTTNP